MNKILLFKYKLSPPISDFAFISLELAEMTLVRGLGAISGSWGMSWEQTFPCKVAAQVQFFLGLQAKDGWSSQPQGGGCFCWKGRLRGFKVLSFRSVATDVPSQRSGSHLFPVNALTFTLEVWWVYVILQRNNWILSLTFNEFRSVVLRRECLRATIEKVL